MSLHSSRPSSVDGNGSGTYRGYPGTSSSGKTTSSAPCSAAADAKRSIASSAASTSIGIADICTAAIRAIPFLPLLNYLDDRGRPLAAQARRGRDRRPGAFHLGGGAVREHDLGTAARGLGGVPPGLSQPRRARRLQ